jgi:hypothetical protein
MTTYTIQNELPPDDYAQLSDFVGRLALLARRGRHVADVAVLVPETSVWATYTPPHLGRFEGYFDCNPGPLAIDRVFRETCHVLAKHQRDFDCLSESLLNRATVETASDGLGTLSLHDEQFRVLVLPEVRLLSQTSLDKLEQFLTAGGHVAFVGSLPRHSAEDGEDPNVTRQANHLIGQFQGQTFHPDTLETLPTLIAWINERVPPQVVWSGNNSIRLLHRSEEDREIVLLANPSRNDANGLLTLPTTGRASVWDPETGRVHNIGPANDSRKVSLRVHAESAKFVILTRCFPVNNSFCSNQCGSPSWTLRFNVGPY